MQVNTVPTSTPSRGLEKRVSRLMNAALSLSGATAPLIADIPYISTAKPSRMSPDVALDLILAEHAQDDADHGDDAGERCGAQQRHPAGAADVRQAEDPAPVMLVPRIEPSTMPMA